MDNTTSAATMFNVENLRPFSHYQIRVATGTVAVGPATTALDVMLPEDGK